MEIVEAIKTRRSIGKVKQDPIARELIEQILEAGTYAPNHRRTEPWRFFVVSGEGRNKFGEVLGEIAAEKCKDPKSEEDIKKIENAKLHPHRSPVIIAVGVEPSEKENILVKEEYAAVNSAAQNMLLTAHSMGLGAVWRTGDVCYHKAVNKFFGMSDRGEILALIYIGYPDMETKEKKVTNFAELTTWID